MFNCLFLVGFAQVKHYKNEINRTLPTNVRIEKWVQPIDKLPSYQTPKYQNIIPSIQWEDTSKLKKSSSYKQNGGRPN